MGVKDCDGQLKRRMNRKIKSLYGTWVFRKKQEHGEHDG